MGFAVAGAGGATTGGAFTQHGRLASRGTTGGGGMPFRITVAGSRDGGGAGAGAAFTITVAGSSVVAGGAPFMTTVAGESSTTAAGAFMATVAGSSTESARIETWG